MVPQSLPGGTTYRINCMMQVVVHDKTEDTMQFITAVYLTGEKPTAMGYLSFRAVKDVGA